jgi:hypothetical protein
MSRIAHSTGKPDMLCGSRWKPTPILLSRVSKNARHGTYLRAGAFPVGAPCFHLKSRMPQSEYTMNIFYIIGVIVVVLFVAGFFGLHA